MEYTNYCLHQLDQRLWWKRQGSAGWPFGRGIRHYFQWDSNHRNGIGIAVESRCGRSLKVGEVITIAANNNGHTRNTIPQAGDLVAGVPRIASVKAKFKNPTPAIGVRIRLRRPIFSMHVAALNCRDLKREDRQDEMTDNNGIITHHTDTWEKSELRS